MTVKEKINTDKTVFICEELRAGYTVTSPRQALTVCALPLVPSVGGP